MHSHELEYIIGILCVARYILCAYVHIRIIICMSMYNTIHVHTVASCVCNYTIGGMASNLTIMRFGVHGKFHWLIQF